MLMFLKMISSKLSAKTKNMTKEMQNTNETEKFRNINIDFTIFRPSGNDTCLLNVTSIPTLNEKKGINDLILNTISNVEQVGFLKPDPQLPQLMMAGGEFCGNATRCAAWQCLNGKPGEVRIKVSGVLNRLRAGVTKEQEAYAQMPIYKDPKNISEDPNIPGNYLVRMEGITHYLDFNFSQLEGLSEEEIKAKSMQEIKRRGLNKEQAAGIIYVSNTNQGYEIVPVVYVRDVDSLYLETACGSGTTALGMALALQSNRSISEIPVLQPSRMTIKISVDYNSKEFGYAQIQGPIENLGNGIVAIRNDKKYLIQSVTNTEQAIKALSQNGLTKLYKDIFSQPPYYEIFDDNQVGDIFLEYFKNGKIFLAKSEEKIIGFGALVPLTQEPELVTLLASSNIDISNTWYMADLGINPIDRRKGLGRLLVQKRIDAAPDNSTIIMRTSVNNFASQSLYKSLGFKQIPDAYQDVINTRTDGTIQTDKRIFLARKK
jgi:histidine racemase